MKNSVWEMDKLNTLFNQIDDLIMALKVKFRLACLTQCGVNRWVWKEKMSEILQKDISSCTDNPCEG